MNGKSPSFAGLFLIAAAVTLGQEPVVAPPESLVIDGGPPVTASLRETVGRYGAYRSAAIVDWHPSERLSCSALDSRRRPSCICACAVVKHQHGEDRDVRGENDACSPFPKRKTQVHGHVTGTP
jgi:hypothetical protein